MCMKCYTATVKKKVVSKACKLPSFYSTMSRGLTCAVVLLELFFFFSFIININVAICSVCSLLSCTLCGFVSWFIQGNYVIFGVNLYGENSEFSASHLLSSSRRRVVQVFERGARVLDGSFMTQELNLGAPNSESGSGSGSGSESSTVLSVSIADPYVLLCMTDGSIRLLVGGMICHVSSP